MSNAYKTFHNIKCDGCGQMLSTEEWYEEPFDDGCWDLMIQESGWETIGKKHYCPDCFTIDDNDNIVPIKRNGTRR